MKNFKLVMMAILVALVFTGCKKDTTSPSSSSTSTITTTIDGSSVNLTSYAYLYSITSGETTYQYLYILGTTAAAGSTNYKAFWIWIYANKITAKTYTVPNYSDSYTYDPITGYAVGEYWSYLNSEISELYYSYGLTGSSGSVTISSISSTNVQGSYDMTLSKSTVGTDATKSLKGSFNVKITGNFTGK